MLLNLINNIAFLIALVAAGQMIVTRYSDHALNRQLLLGLLFGGVTLLGMANPINFAPGVFFDGRSIVLTVAGVVGGGLTAAVAASMAAFYRYQLGGIGAPVGISVVLMSALIGVMARQWWQKRDRTPRPIDFLVLGIVVQVLQLAAFTQVPNRAGYGFIEQAWWVLIFFYPLATMFLCVMFSDHDRRQSEQKALLETQDALIAEERASMERFRAFFDHSIVGLAITNLKNDWIEVNDALCSSLGYARDELINMTWSEITYPEDLAPDLFQFNRMLAGEINSYAMDKRFVHKSGRIVYTRLAVSCVRKTGGSVDYVIAMVEDITARKEAEISLQESESTFKKLFSESSDPILLIDSTGVFVECNQAALDLLKMTRAQFLNLSPEQISPEFQPGGQTSADLAPKMIALAYQKERNRFDWVCVNSEGKEFIVEMSLMPITLHGQTHLHVTWRDVTARKENEASLRSSKARLRFLLTSSPAIIYTCQATPPYAATFISNNIEELLGYQPMQFTQNPDFWADHIHPDDQSRVFSDLPKLFEHGSHQHDYRFQLPDGTYRWLHDEVKVIYSPTGEPEQLIGYWADVSELKHAEMELTSYRDHLEQLVKGRTEELAAAKEAAEVANRAKSAFLANMSHEIRTPLNAITGMVHIIRQSGVPPDQSDRLDKIEAAGHHLLEIINAVLDLSKIEAKKFDLKESEVRIDKLVEEVAAMIRPSAAAKKLTLKTEVSALPRLLLGDSTRLQQALINYASNAVKFTQQGGISLRARAVEDRDESVVVRFEVEDTGMGIAETEISRLFSAFEQADNSLTRGFGGTGLGLAITKNIAMLMGGEAGVTSQPDVGSTFWFTAVLKKPHADFTSAPATDLANAEALLKRDFAGARVLVVDDEPMNCIVFSEFLALAGLESVQASNGLQAVDAIGSQPFDLVLMDMQMPQMDGLMATRKIRTLPNGMTVPILALTGNAFDSDKERCLAAGMNDFIAKPVQSALFYQTLLRWLTAARDGG